MAGNTKALVVAVCMMFLNNLYECVPMDGYKFPVYTTASCPKNKAEWLMRSFVLNCTDQNGYMCIPDENITVLVEFCYTKNVQAIPKGYCLILNKRSSAVDAYRCQNFSYGCPSHQYFSNMIYKYQSCVSIVQGCFFAESYCERNVSANRNTTTSKNNTDHTDEDLQIIRTPGLLLTISMYAVALLIIAGFALMIGIIKIIKAIRKKCERESSRNQNSNPWPLTDGATDQTTEPLMSTKIQKTTFRESTSGLWRAKSHPSSNPDPLTYRANDQTTELFITTNIHKIAPEGPRAGGEESSLDQGSNPGRRKNHWSI